MDEKVPYIVFEGEMARHERTIISGEAVSVDSRDAGIANYIGEDGTINNGRGEGN